MKATIAAALIGIFLLAGVSDIFAKPGWGSYDPATYTSTDAACFARVCVGTGKKHGLTRETG